FCRDQEVGIDIEKIRNLPDLNELIEKNFTSSEIVYIKRNVFQRRGHVTSPLKNKKNERDMLKRFFQFWTIKEAYLKAIGEGMRLSPDKLEFAIESGNIKLRSVKGIFEQEDWLFKEVAPGDNYVGTLAYKGSQGKLKIKEFIPPLGKGE
ncbi:MAG: 4'-phosphopantetheinyl transferase superfamily protein, partial [Bacteroidetes bacterium]|nr:4'-phosphopantetheinyl transferase superfamily protein [Bacteroidota bacterium]